jgi:hypothetical protein
MIHNKRYILSQVNQWKRRYYKICGMEDDNESMRETVSDANLKQFRLLKERDRQELYPTSSPL